MKKALLMLLLSTAMTLPAQAAPGDNPKCQDHPVFSRFSGERLDSCEQNRFSELSLKRWKNPAKPNSGVDYFKVEGEYWYHHGIIDKDASGRPAGQLEVQRNYENAVRQAKGTILYVTGGRVFYHISRPDGDYWGETGCGGGDGVNCASTMHKTIRTAPMQQSVVVTADQIAKSVQDDGKVVFYGIYFDTDQSTLKKESAPTMAELGKWLKTNAKAKVAIVGHTDMQGSTEHNLELSRNRAAAVVAELTANYGINSDRLQAVGVGPHAPVSTNKTDAGRAKNRRVEMVLR